METPWSVSEEAPVLLDNNLQGTGNNRKSVEDAGDAGRVGPLLWLVRGFQGFISPVDGDRCAMYPTCSGYSVDALKKHGPFMGFILTADRVMHETDEHLFAPGIIKHGVYRVYDPVERNDFWWAK